MRYLQRLLLRWAPARALESSARRALYDVPGIRTIDGLRVETAAGQPPRVTLSLRVAAGRDPGTVSRSAALAIFERLPPVQLRIRVLTEPSPDEGARVLPFGPM